MKTRLDFEKSQFQEISILAEDRGEPILHSPIPALVKINVLDINDNFPVFDLPKSNALCVYLANEIYRLI